MLKIIALFTALLAAALVFPLVSHAACVVTAPNGISYVDSDCDGVGDDDDNCPLVRNGDCDRDPEYCDINLDGILSDEERAAGEQIDWNGDEIGNACADTDGDGIDDYLDNCPATFNPGQDGRDCTDTDGDGIEDSADNCVKVPNSTHTDTDGDGFGDACDVCPFVFNPGQSRDDCSDENAGPLSPDESPEYDGPNRGVVYGPLQTHAVGSGGCHLAAGVHGSPWALLLISAAGVVALRRRRE